MGPVSGYFSPYLAPMSQVMPPGAFDNLIAQRGVRLYWLKGHTCACTWGGDTPGSPDNGCQTCFGRGVWWDQPFGPFQALITFIHTSPTPDEPGSRVDTDQGLYVNGEPALTLAYTLSPTVWADAALFDQFVEVDAINKFTARLISGSVENVPYQQNLSVAASGAVTIYDTVNRVVITGVPYTVSGTAVTIASSYPLGTNYTVDFVAAPSYVAYRVAGMPAHVRPFMQLNYPRRFRLQNLDLFSRARFSGDIPRV